MDHKKKVSRYVFYAIPVLLAKRKKIEARYTATSGAFGQEQCGQRQQKYYTNKM